MSKSSNKSQKFWWLLHALATIGLLFLFRVPIIAGPLLLIFAVHTYIRWELLTHEEKPILSELEQLLQELDSMRANIDCAEIRRVLAELEKQQQRFEKAIGHGSDDLRQQMRSTTIQKEERDALQLHLDAVIGAEQKLEAVHARQRQILHQLKAFHVYLLQLDSEDEGLDLDNRVKALKEVLEATQKITF